MSELPTDTPLPFVGLETVILCRDPEAAARHLRTLLGLKLERILPADDPTTAVVTGGAIRLRLEKSADADLSTKLVLRTADPALLAAYPDAIAVHGAGLIRLEPVEPVVENPTPVRRVVISRRAQDQAWITGRAGMEYRDLIPDRLGGGFIASHIRINEGGPVPDYVHYHHVHFQLIHCYRGWVRLVYEDQGEPFILQAGDCVLQPPRIRHRVLEASDGLEVIELGVPAIHETWADHEMPLPNNRVDPNRDFSGQRFVRHRAQNAVWQPGPLPFTDHRDTGIGAATAGVASVTVWRANKAAAGTWQHQTPFWFGFVLAGMMTTQIGDDAPVSLSAGESLTVPTGTPIHWQAMTPDTEILSVNLPGSIGWTPVA